jgi:hypothetical protein
MMWFLGLTESRLLILPNDARSLRHEGFEVRGACCSCGCHWQLRDEAHRMSHFFRHLFYPGSCWLYKHNISASAGQGVSGHFPECRKPGNRQKPLVITQKLANNKNKLENSR